MQTAQLATSFVLIAHARRRLSCIVRGKCSNIASKYGVRRDYSLAPLLNSSYYCRCSNPGKTLPSFFSPTTDHIQPVDVSGVL